MVLSGLLSWGHYSLHCCFYLSVVYPCLRSVILFIWGFFFTPFTWFLASNFSAIRGCSCYKPIMEQESADKKFGNVAGYRAYKSRTRSDSVLFLVLLFSLLKLMGKREVHNFFCTSPLIPLPPAMYGNLPSWFKMAFLLEFPFYSRNLPQEGLSW